MTRIKVCGITNLKDAECGVELGVDSLGFIFAPSPRQAKPKQVKNIIERLPPFINQTGVFVNEEISKVQEIADYCGLDTLQFHGEESPKYCRRFENRKVIKAFRVQQNLDLEQLTAYEVAGYLLDTYVSGQAGGTGETFNWDLALQAKQVGNIILAGGLNPANITGAIKHVAPYGVDVNSGVEQEPGLKDKEKLNKLVAKIGRLNYARQ